MIPQVQHPIDVYSGICIHAWCTVMYVALTMLVPIPESEIVDILFIRTMNGSSATLQLLQV